MDQPAVRPPLPVMVLGAGGLLPPVAGVAALLMLPAGMPRDLAWVLLVFYAALIFSFLGGTWWAFSASEPRASWLVMAVLPSLVAVGLLLLTLDPGTRRWAVALLAVAICASPLADRTLGLAGLTPRWWLVLRVPLSIGLAACVAVAAWQLPTG